MSRTPSGKTKNIYDRAIERWGEEFHIVLAVEELSELIQALCRRYRGRVDNASSVPEEIADVRIMIEILETMLDCSEETRTHYIGKLRRLEERLSVNDQNYR